MKYTWGLLAFFLLAFNVLTTNQAKAEAYPPVPKYAAIAYSNLNGNWGMSWNKGSRWEAEATAKQACGDYTCNPVIWSQNGCVAISTSRSEGHAGWAHSPNQMEAVNLAYNACLQTGSRFCENTASTCAYFF